MVNNPKKARLLIKSNILNDNTQLLWQEKEYKQVLDLVNRTVNAGESNSALLIGPRGAGKTKLINNVLTELQSDKGFVTNAVLVRLNGLIHTDDRLALISTTSQMNLDNAVDGKVFGSFAENLAFLLACLRSGNKDTSKSVIFVIEEFDLFCFHHNQTLLYNLFDISQSAQAPICVLGITCRLDVIELLEKRVKSRFSHRQYFIFTGSQDNELDLRMNRIQELLSLKKSNEIDSSFVKKWNASIKNLVTNKKLKSLMQRLLDIDLNENTLKNMLIVIVSSVHDSKDSITVEDFEEQMKSFERDEVVEQLLDLSVLEFCLVISMKHHLEIYDNQAMNFEMIFTRYIKFANSNSNMQIVERPVVMKAFEHIQNMELIQNISSNTSRLQKEYEMFKLLVTPRQISEAIKKWPSLPTEVAQWAISSFV